MKLRKSDPATCRAPQGGGLTGHNTKLNLWPRHNLQTSSCQRSSLVTSFNARRRNPTCFNPASLSQTPDYDTRAAMGGTQVNMPHWNDLTGQPAAVERFCSFGAGETRR